MAVATYSPGDLAISFKGSEISGFADGTVVTVDREVDSFTKHVGADGEVSRTRSADRSGTVTLTLKQTSDSNLVLGGYLNADEKGTASNIGELVIKDNLTNKVFSGEAWISKQPTFSRGDEQENVEWAFQCADLSWTWPSA